MKNILLAILPGAKVFDNKLKVQELLENLGIFSTLKERGFSTSTADSLTLANECLEQTDLTILVGHTCWQSEIEHANTLNAIAFMQNLAEREQRWGILTALSAKESFSTFLQDQSLVPCFLQSIENGFLEALSQKMQRCMCPPRHQKV